MRKLDHDELKELCRKATLLLLSAKNDQVLSFDESGEVPRAILRKARSGEINGFPDDSVENMSWAIYQRLFVLYGKGFK